MFSRWCPPILATIVIAVTASPAAERRPNVVVIVADDLGYGELGCQGNEQIPTPNIDAIAAAGVRFTDGYVTMSLCSPSRAALVTGRYQTRFGYETNPVGARNEDPTIGLPTSEVTLAEHLRLAGYATALIGKWHLGGTAECNPLHRGFDTFFGFRHEGHYYVPPPYFGVTTWLRRRALPDGGEGRWESHDGSLVLSTHMGHDEPAYDADNPILLNGQQATGVPYLTDAFSGEAVRFIDRHAHRPFFLYLAYNAVHSPMQARDEDMERFSTIDDVHRRIFAAMLARLDDGVGSVTEALRRHHLLDETLIIFLSDNGGPTRELTSSNLPLRGGKGDLYEGGVRIPFLVQWTGILPAGETYRNPILSTDAFATASAAAGLPMPADRETDGVDLVPYLTGAVNERPHELLFWRYGRKRAIRLGDRKLVDNDGRGWELYDLAADVDESDDLAAARPDLVRELSDAWDRKDAELTATDR